MTETDSPRELKYFPSSFFIDSFANSREERRCRVEGYELNPEPFQRPEFRNERRVTQRTI